MRDFHQLTGGERIRDDPGSGNVREEDLRRPGHAEARVDALLAFVEKCQVSTLDFLDAISRDRTGWWCCHRRDLRRFGGDWRRRNRGKVLGGAALELREDVTGGGYAAGTSGQCPGRSRQFTESFDQKAPRRGSRCQWRCISESNERHSR